MMKEVPCPKCQGHGFISNFNEYSAWAETCSDCSGSGVIMQPMTNADRVRTMSDEELAVFQAKRCAEAVFKEKEANGISVSETAKKALVMDLCRAWLRYFKQPAEED